MHAEDRTLSVVFETSVRLMVPLFQRPYVWKEPDNWEWHTNWPLPEGADGDQEDFRNHMIHTFGNLSLVTGKLNPSLSKAGWSDKRAALGEHSALAVNRQLQQYEEWDEKRILERSIQIGEIALKLWPRPA